VIAGNPGKRPLPPPDPLPAGSIERPENLDPAVAVFWDRFIARAFWLTWADGPKALMWCCLMSEFQQSPTKMLSARIAQLRALGSELGFDAASRTRMSIAEDGTKYPEAKYLSGADGYFA
jgi:hypothetical protein